jgi:hypothetical protein
VQKKAQITQERVEYNVFLFDEPLKGSKSLKIFKISLTFRFDKLSNLSKSVHTGENSQILTVSNKKNYFLTPIPHPVTRGQQLYNNSHIKTRNVIERQFGCWKRRFPVLAYGCRIKIETTLTLIVATAVL